VFWFSGFFFTQACYYIFQYIFRLYSVYIQCEGFTLN
jgi:hypothetical protein